MAYQFVFTKNAETDLKDLGAVERKRILKKLSQLSSYDTLQNISKTLLGEFSAYSRIRVGQYRLACEIVDGVVTVLRVRHRREVYR